MGRWPRTTGRVWCDFWDTTGLDGAECLVGAMPWRCERWVLDPEAVRWPADACRFVAGRWFEAECWLIGVLWTEEPGLVCCLGAVAVSGLYSAVVLRMEPA